MKYYKGAIYFTKLSKSGLYKINLKSPKKVICLSKEDIQDIVKIDDTGLYYSSSSEDANYRVSLDGKKNQLIGPIGYNLSLFIDEGKLFGYNSPSGIYQIEKNKLIKKVFENMYGDYTKPDEINQTETMDNVNDVSVSSETSVDNTTNYDADVPDIIINPDFNIMPLCINSEYIYYTISDWVESSPHTVADYEKATGKEVVVSSTLRRTNLNNGHTEILLDLNENYEYIGKFCNVMYFIDNENNLFFFNTDKKIMQQVKYETRILGNVIPKK